MKAPAHTAGWDRQYDGISRYSYRALMLVLRRSALESFTATFIMSVLQQNRSSRSSQSGVRESEL